MRTDVTAGWARTNTVARWVTHPASAAKCVSCPTASALALLAATPRSKLRAAVAARWPDVGSDRLTTTRCSAAHRSKRPCRSVAPSQHGCFDDPGEDRVPRLLRPKAVVPARLGRPLRLDDQLGRKVEEPTARTLPERISSESADSVSSMSVL